MGGAFTVVQVTAPGTTRLGKTAYQAARLASRAMDGVGCCLEVWRFWYAAEVDVRVSTSLGHFEGFRGQRPSAGTAQPA